MLPLKKNCLHAPSAPSPSCPAIMPRRLRQTLGRPDHLPRPLSGNPTTISPSAPTFSTTRKDSAPATPPNILRTQSWAATRSAQPSRTLQGCASNAPGIAPPTTTPAITISSHQPANSSSTSDAHKCGELSCPRRRMKLRTPFSRLLSGARAGSHESQQACCSGRYFAPSAPKPNAPQPPSRPRPSFQSSPRLQLPPTSLDLQQMHQSQPRWPYA